jgi:hypothetical protein
LDRYLGPTVKGMFLSLNKSLQVSEYSFSSTLCKFSLVDTAEPLSSRAGATIGYFPVDLKSLEYLRQTNRDETKIQLIQEYLAAVGMLR